MDIKLNKRLNIVYRYYLKTYIWFLPLQEEIPFEYLREVDKYYKDLKIILFKVNMNDEYNEIKKNSL